MQFPPWYGLRPEVNDQRCTPSRYVRSIQTTSMESRRESRKTRTTQDPGTSCKSHAFFHKRLWPNLGRYILTLKIESLTANGSLCFESAVGSWVNSRFITSHKNIWSQLRPCSFNPIIEDALRLSYYIFLRIKYKSGSIESTWRSYTIISEFGGGGRKGFSFCMKEFSWKTI